MVLDKVFCFSEFLKNLKFSVISERREFKIKTGKELRIFYFFINIISEQNLCKIEMFLFLSVRLAHNIMHPMEIRNFFTHRLCEALVKFYKLVPSSPCDMCHRLPRKKKNESLIIPRNRLERNAEHRKSVVREAPNMEKAEDGKKRAHARWTGLLMRSGNVFCIILLRTSNLLYNNSALHFNLCSISRFRCHVCSCCMQFM